MNKIYKITNKINNKYYIGITKQTISKRFSQHKECSRRKKTHLYNAFNKYGVENFYIEILYTFENREEAFKKEIELISLNPNGYNTALGGEGGFVVQNIEEWKDKLRTARVGQTPALGLKHSEETKQKCKEACLKYLETIEMYDFNEMKDLSHKDAKLKFGISTTHYYRLKNRFKNNELKQI